MANISGYNIFDPWEKNPQPVFVDQYTHVERRAIDLIAEIYEKNKKAGKHDPFCVCAIHRAKGIHRWFQLNMNIPSRGVRCEREYGGALSMAEALLDGPWRIGSDAEELECRAADEKESIAAQNKNALNSTNGVMAALTTNIQNLITSNETVRTKGK